MPQISLYIDKKTLEQIETAAKIENLSISKYVVKKLHQSMHMSWPEQYEQLYGSIDDETFHAPEELDFTHDTPRETL